MRYLIAAAVFAYLGYAGSPIYGAEMLTPKQMDQVTAGVIKWNFTAQLARASAAGGCSVFRSSCSGLPAVATSTNSNSTSQANGPDS